MDISTKYYLAFLIIIIVGLVVRLVIGWIREGKEDFYIMTNKPMFSRGQVIKSSEVTLKIIKEKRQKDGYVKYRVRPI